MLLAEKVQFQPASDSSLLLVFGATITEPIHTNVIRYFQLLNARAPHWLENLHPAYTTLLVDFNPRLMTHAGVTRWIQNLADENVAMAPAQQIELAVRYDGADLEELAGRHGLTVSEVVRLHSAASYRVAFLGFAPGFAYLMGLDPQLATPRLATPRLRVPAGSVAIGGGQTGVYPADSPGGWHIIGHILRPTPLPADWIAPGDRLRFVPVA